MAFTLRDALKKEKGGMIGVTIDGKQKWFEEGDFMDLFDKEETKELLVDAMKYGRDPESRPKKEEAEPESPEQVSLKAKADVSSPEKWDETEPETTFDENVAKDVPPEPTNEQVAQADTPMQKIESRVAPEDPYSKKDEFEKITPENFPVMKRKAEKAFETYRRKKYGFVKEIDWKVAAQTKVANMEEEWFDEFAQRNGERGMQFAMMDDYKKSKDPDLKQFVQDWEVFHLNNKQEIYNQSKDKYRKIVSQEKEEIYRFTTQMDEERKRVGMEAKAQSEEAKKYTPDNQVKDLENLVKVSEQIREATEEGNKLKVTALERKRDLLQERVLKDVKGADKMIEHLQKNRNYSYEQAMQEVLDFARKS